ncbi:MAG: SpoIIE family protein phosphatase [Chlamydiales bacterium]|nr:SpoIIE family protein phosphatase [Chlamydiales bacterium]
MIPFRKTIGFRLVIVGFVMLSLPLLVDGLVVLRQRYESAVEEAKNYLTEAAVLRVLPIEQFYPMSRESFEAIAYFLGLREHFPAEPDRKMTQKLIELARIGNFNNLSVVRVSKEGKYTVVASAREDIVGDDVTSYFEKPNPFEVYHEYGEHILTYTSFRDTLELFFVSGFPIRSLDTGEPLGLIASVVPAKWTSNSLLALDNVHYPVRFALLNPESIVVDATDHRFLFQHFHPLTEKEWETFWTKQGFEYDLFPQKSLKILKPMTKGSFMEFMWEGKVQLGVLERLTNSQYTLVAYASKEDVLIKPLRDFVGIYISYALILVIGTCFVYWVTKRWMRSVRTLSSVMLRVEQGDLQARYVADKWGHQINHLGLHFNEMLDSLLTSQERAESERLQRENLARELELGQEAQEKLLTIREQDLGEVDLARIYIPAIKVGGDYFDFFRKPNGKLIVSVADASGKGVFACCFSLAARSFVRTIAEQDDDVAHVLFRANHLFCEETKDSGMFVTVGLGQYDYETHVFTYYSLGHNPPIICRKDGTLELLENRDIAMGVIEKNEQGQAHETVLNKGDVIVFYTDGVTEAHNIKNELYGEKRLEELVKENRYLSAHGLIEVIKKSVASFAGEAQQHDDITILVLRRHD